MRIQRSLLERIRQEVSAAHEGSFELSSRHVVGLGGEDQFGGRLSKKPTECVCLRMSLGWGPTTPITVDHGAWSVWDNSRIEELPWCHCSDLNSPASRVTSRNPGFWITWFEILSFNLTSLWAILLAVCSLFFTVHWTKCFLAAKHGS